MTKNSASQSIPRHDFAPGQRVRLQTKRQALRKLRRSQSADSTNNAIASSLLKRGINGFYVSVEPFHSFRYLDEQAFRYNNRNMTILTGPSQVEGKPANLHRIHCQGGRTTIN